MWPFSRKDRRQLGVDVGTSAVKIVELEHSGNRLTLTNYAVLDGSDFFGEMPGGSNIPSGLKMSDDDIASALKRLLAEAKIKTKTAVMSIPIFSSFLTVMELPNLAGKELESAVPFEARSYVPVPLSEVVLDWLVIPSHAETAAVSSVQNKPAAAATVQEKLNVLLIAVPKEVVSKYQRVAAAAGLELRALESESFSLSRALVGNDLSTIMLVDFGAANTNLTVIDGGFIFMSHSADLSGKEITKAISRSLNVASARAEELKRSIGISAAGLNKGIAQALAPVVDKLVAEMEKMISLILKKEGRRVEKVVLSGGSSNLPGLKEYLSSRLGVEVLVGNPFSKIKFDPALDKILRQEFNSTLAVATGLAMREL